MSSAPKKKYPFACGYADAAVHGVVGAIIGPAVNDQSRAEFRAETVRDVEGPIGRTAVDKDHFHFPVGLPDDASEAGLQRHRCIEGRDNYREHWRSHDVCNASSRPPVRAARRGRLNLDSRLGAREAGSPDRPFGYRQGADASIYVNRPHGRKCRQLEAFDHCADP